MKALMISVIAVVVLTGCCTGGRTSSPSELVMVRTVPVAKYKETVSSLHEEIEKHNNYEARDIQTSVNNGYVTIAMYAERMTVNRSRDRHIIKLQNEVVRLTRENADLKKELQDAKKTK